MSYIPSYDKIVGLISEALDADRLSRRPTRLGVAGKRADLAGVRLTQTVDRLDAERVVGPA